MGARGPAPQATAITIAKGNPAKRPLNHREPKHSHSVPQCPKWLSTDAKREWRYLIEELGNVPGLLAKVDLSLLSIYADSMATFRQACEALQDEPPCTDRSRSGWSIIKKDSADMLVKISGKLGLSPADRTRIMCDPAQADDIDSKFDRLVLHRTA